MKNDSKNTILIIEDEVPVRMSITAYLEDHGYKVLEAENGRIGLQIFRREAPDLILVDLRMPEVDGLEVLASVTAESPGTPIIVVSGTGRVGDAVEALRLGAWDYMLKPISNMDVLLHAVQKALEKSKLLIENKMYHDQLEALVKERTAELEKEIQERRRTEVTLKESEERYRTLINTAREGVWVIDTEMRTTFVNRQMANMLGHRVEEIVGKTVPEFLDEENAAMFRQRFKERKQGHGEQYDLKLRRKDGTEMWGIVSASPLFGVEGEVVGAFAMVTDVTERKQAEDALKASERNYREIYNGTNDSIIVYDMTTGTILDVNQKASEMLGYDSEKLKELSVKDISQGEPPYSEQEALQWIRKAVEEGPQCLEWLLKKKNGDLLWVEVNLKQTTISGQNRLLAVARDITYRKRIQEERLKHLSFLENLERINRVIRSATDIEEMMGDALETSLSIFNCDRTWLFYPCDPDALSWHVPMERTKPEYPGLYASGEKCAMTPDIAEICRKLLNSGDPIIDLQSPGMPGRDLQDKYAVQSTISMAIYPKVGKPWKFGLHQCSHARVWTEEEQRLFKEIGNRITEALSNLLFLRDLRESEELYKNLYETSLVGLWRTRIGDGKFIRSNQKNADILDVETADELIKNYSASEFYSPERRTELIEMLKKDGEVSDFEVQLLLKNGKEKDISISAKMFPEKGYIEGAIIDITDRKKAEKAFKTSERNYQEIFNTSNEAIFVHDMETGAILDVNQTMCEMFGYTREEAVKLNVGDFSQGEPPYSMDYARQWVRKAVKKGTQRFEWLAKRKSGELFWDETHLKRALIGGQECILAFVSDITERKQAEEALRESEEKYRNLVESTQDLVWTCDLKGRHTYINQAIQDILGYEVCDVMDQLVVDYVHTEDRPRVDKLFQEAVEHKKGWKDIVIRWRHKDGSIRFLETRAQPIWDDQGRLVGFSGIDRDITERKQAEAKIRESEEKYRLLFDTTEVLVSVYNREGICQLMNRRVAALFGGEPEDFIGKSIIELHPKDGRDYLRSFHEAIDSGIAHQREDEVPFPQGCRWLLTQLRPVPDAQGVFRNVQIISQDITERKLAEEALRESAEYHQIITNTSMDGFAVTNSSGKFLEVNEVYCRMLGYSRDELLKMTVTDVEAIETTDEIIEHIKQITETGSDRFETRHRRKDGCIIDVEVSITPMQQKDLQLSFVRDITKRKQAEDALRQEKFFSDTLIDGMPGVLSVFDEQGRFVRWNKRLESTLGYTAEELSNLHPMNLFIAKEKNLIMEKIQEVLTEGEAEAEANFATKYGRTLPYHIIGVRILIDGKPHVLGTGHDISDLKRVEEALEKRIVALTQPLDAVEGIAFEDLFNLSEIQRLQDLYAEAFGVAALITLPDGTPITQPSNFSELCGEIIRKTPKGIENCNRSDAIIGRHNTSGPNIQSCLSAGLCNAGASITVGGRHVANWLIGQVRNEAQKEEEIMAYAREIGADETAFRNAYHKVPVMSQEQFERVAHVLFELTKQISTTAYQNVQQARFIAERRRVEKALKEAYDIINRSPAVAFLWKNDEHWSVEFVSDNVQDLFGYTADEFTSGQVLYAMTIHPDDLEKIKQEVIRYSESEEVEDFVHIPYRIITKDGKVKWIEDRTHIRRDEKGRITHYEGIVEDITEVKVAQEEKAKIQKQLQQAQKMEAIGTLAGGIAHDFNNILGAIIGYAGMMEIFDVSEDSPMRARIKEVLKAANRAKDLVEQILTFSRQTEQERKPVQLNYIVREALKFLRASLPTTIEICQHIENKELIALADPTQMHQILMNLCTNAAHAMLETGGRLEIKLSALDLDIQSVKQYPELKPGPHLKLTVSDSGHGMTPEVIERIFDPFFTTKKPGEGTGMGLAVVHGIVKSHKGVIIVDSELGKNTVFQIILPRIELETVEAGREADSSMPTGTERILFIDDEEYLAMLIQEILDRLGYEVTTKTNSREALELFRKQPERFDLVITDQTMPHMTGIELAREMMEIRSNIPVILCTGYSETATPEKVAAAGIRELIYKPLDPSGLANTVRRVLDE